MDVDSKAMKLVKPAIGPAILMLVLAGCRDDRRHQATEVTTLEAKADVVAANASPEDVTKALLARLAKAQRARARGLGNEANRDEYLATMAEVRGLAAKSSIFENYRARGGAQVPIDLKEDGAVRIVTESWVSICAHYADRLETASMQPPRITGKNAAIIAEVAPVSGSDPSDRTKAGARIVCRLLMDSGNSWKVQRVEMDSQIGSIVGNTAPASRPAAASTTLPATHSAG